jgi:transposase
MGQTVRLIPPIYVKRTVKRGKNDAAGDRAEAMARPGMRCRSRARHNKRH